MIIEGTTTIIIGIMNKVLVIGAGIVGLFTAYYLNNRGYEVEVIEKEGELGKGISGNNAGVLHLIQQPFNSIKSILAREGIKKYREVVDTLEIELYDTKLRIVGFTYLDRIYLNLIASVLGRNGFKVSKHDTRESGLPNTLNRGIKYYIEIDGYGIVEPKMVLERLSEYLESNGVDIKLSTTAYQDEKYSYIVVAAGPHTYSIGEKLGDDIPKHRYGLGVMIEVDITLDSIYALPPNPIRRYTKGGAAIPHKGYTLLGPGFKWVDNIEARPGERDVEEVYKRFVRIFREPPKILSTSYGVRPINYPKDDFIIRKRGRYIFTYGIDSPGFTAAPAIGIIIANMIRDENKSLEITRDNLKIYMAEP